MEIGEQKIYKTLLIVKRFEILFTMYIERDTFLLQDET